MAIVFRGRCTREVSNGSFSQEGSEVVTNGDFALNSMIGWCKTKQMGTINGKTGGVNSSVFNLHFKCFNVL